MLPAILATTLSPLHSSCLVISDSLAWNDVDSLLTSSLLLGFADIRGSDRAAPPDKADLKDSG